MKKVAHIGQQIRKPMLHWHVSLSKRFPLYDRWHQHPHHKKVHWGVLALYVLMITSMLLSSIFPGGQSAIASSNTWDFSTGSDYTLSNSTTVAVSSGVGRLKGVDVGGGTEAVPGTNWLAKDGSNNAWKYRKAFTVTNGTGSPLTNTQVGVDEGLTASYKADEVSATDAFATTVDTTRWTTTGAGTASISSGRLQLQGTSGSTAAAGVHSNGKVTLRGDFDVQVDFDASSQPTPSNANIPTELRLNGSTYLYEINMVKNSAAALTYSTYTTQTAATFGTATGASTGKLRAVRVGSTMYAYYWSGTAWVRYGTQTTVDTSDMYITLLTYNNTNTGGQIPLAYFDNFQVNAGIGTADSSGNSVNARITNLPTSQNDAFTTVINPMRWGQFSGNSAAISSSRLFAQSAATSGSNSGVTGNGKWWLKGDFDISVDFDNSAQSNNVVGTLEGHLNVNDGTTSFSAKIVKNGSNAVGLGSDPSDYTANFAGGTAYGADTGKLRLVRSSATFTAYYWNGSSWVSYATAGSLSTNDVYVSLYTANAAAGAFASKTYFDNFTVNSGTVIPASSGGWTLGGTARTGGSGTSLAVNGAYATLSSAGSLDAYSQITVAGWIKASSLPASSAAFVMGKDGSYRFQLGSSGGMSFTVGTANNSWFSTGTTATLASNLSTSTWYHVVGTYDGTRVKIYLNGSNMAQGSQAISGAITNSGTSSPFSLGASTQIPEALFNFDGSFDDIKVFNRALTATEVTNLYNNNVSGMYSEMFSNARSDGGDIRFTSSDGVTELSYYKATYATANDNAKFVVQVPSIAANGSTTIYAYYGNSSATTTSGGSQTAGTATTVVSSTVLGPIYSTANPTITNATAQGFVSISAFSETLAAGSTGTTTYQISKDGGTTWYWYNSGWTTTSSGVAESNSASVINTNIGTFFNNTTAKSFKWRAYLTSNGAQQPLIDSISIVYIYDSVAPPNPSSVTVNDVNGSSTILTTGNWYHYPTPHFAWDASVDQANTGAGEIVTGTAGYYVYFGTNASADPTSFQVGTTYDASSLVDGSTYYFRIKVADNTGNVSTPSTLFTYKYGDDAAPNDVSSVTAKDTNGGSVTLTTNTWYSYTGPYFSWTAATDNTGSGVAASGVAGYYVYFGTNSSADPASAGSFQTGTTYTASSLAAGNTYYLKIKVKDNHDLVSSGTSLFTYKYDNEAPESPVYVSVDPSGTSRDKNFTFTWPSAGGNAASDTGGSGVYGYQYRIRNAAGTFSSWSSTITTATYAYTIPVSDADYVGVNIFYLRAVDTAGNTDASPVQVNFLYALPTTAPRNLAVDPTSSSTNSFSFSWTAPLTTTGTVQGYYYSINALPTSNNATLVTGTSLSASSYATQQGKNTLYILAKDDNPTNFGSCSLITGNPLVDGCASVDFYANTAAPGIPTSFFGLDASSQELNDYSVILKWQQPAFTGTGFSGYDLYRTTTKNAATNTYTKIGSSSSINYIDNNVTKDTAYYYYVVSKDNAAQTSAPSTIVTVTPTGKWTEAPTIVKDSLTTEVKAFTATITWETTRVGQVAGSGKASSFIYYGTDPDKIGKENGGFTSGDPEKSVKHSVVLTGLQPESTYYFQPMWEDVDGNRGLGDVGTFDTKDRPRVTNVKVSNITLNSATISYTTSSATNSEVQFGKSTSYGGSVKEESGSQTTNHTINLTDLDHSSTYHYTIKGTDIDGNVIDVGTDFTFNTLTKPKIDGNVTMEQVTDAPVTTYRFSWKTNIETTSIVYYTVDGKKNSQSTPEPTKDHEITVTNLADQSTYTFEVNGVDGYGNVVENPFVSNVTTPEDSRAPKVSNLTVEVKTTGFGDAQKAQLVVSWETDEPASSQLEYDEGISGTEYSVKTKEDTALSTTHVVVATELQASKIYHLRAVSRDKSGNAGYSDDTTTITGKGRQSVLDIIVTSLEKSLGWAFNVFK